MLTGMIRSQKSYVSLPPVEGSCIFNFGRIIAPFFARYLANLRQAEGAMFLLLLGAFNSEFLLMQAQREVFDAEFQHVNGQYGLSKMAQSLGTRKTFAEELWEKYLDTIFTKYEVLSSEKSQVSPPPAPHAPAAPVPPRAPVVAVEGESATRTGSYLHKPVFVCDPL